MKIYRTETRNLFVFRSICAYIYTRVIRNKVPLETFLMQRLFVCGKLSKIIDSRRLTRIYLRAVCKRRWYSLSILRVVIIRICKPYVRISISLFFNQFLKFIQTLSFSLFAKLIFFIKNERILIWCEVSTSL